MRITIGSDHAGTALKDEVKMVLMERDNLEVKDVGTFGSEPVDYPDIAEKVAKEVAEGRSQFGILICGTGIGVSIAANKIHGIRCALCSDVFSAKMARKHNDANILALGARVIGFGLAGEIVRTWLDNDFEGVGRHQRRVEKVMSLESQS